MFVHSFSGMKAQWIGEHKSQLRTERVEAHWSPTIIIWYLIWTSHREIFSLHQQDTVPIFLLHIPPHPLYRPLTYV